MSIRAEFQDQLKDAMREKDRNRLDVIRQIEAEISLVKSAPGFDGEVDDDLYRTTIRSYVKKMGKAREEFLAVGERGAEQAAKLAYEIDYLSQWLPSSLGEDETRALVKVAVSELGADNPKMTGQVIGHVMKSGAQVDGGLVNQLVREELQVP